MQHETHIQEESTGLLPKLLGIGVVIAIVAAIGAYLVFSGSL